jgi:hypothetical protein
MGFIYAQGTAVQNDYVEMWTLLDWSNPGKLGTLNQWKATIANPLKLGQASNANEEQLIAARVR